MTDDSENANKNAAGGGDNPNGPADGAQSGHADQQPDPQAAPSGDPTDATEKLNTERMDTATPTEESPRAYSQVGRTDTAQFQDPGHTAQFGHDDGFAPIPPGAHTGAQPGVVSTAPSRRSRGKIIGAIAAAVVLVLVIAAVGSELYLRNKATDCMESAFTELTGTETNVSLSRKPMLLQGFGNDIPFVQVDTVDQPGQMRLHARAEGIHEDGDQSSIRSLVGSGYVPFERIVAMSKTAQTGASSSGNGAGEGASGLMQGATIESVTGNAAEGTIQVDSAVQLAFLPIPVSTTIKPVLQDGRVRFEVVKANAFIFGIPADYAQQVVDQVSGSMLGSFFDDVTVTDLKVTDQGVDFAVDGRDVALSGQVTGGSGECSAA